MTKIWNSLGIIYPPRIPRTKNKFPVAEFKEFERRFKFKPRLEIISNVSRFKPAINLNRVLADLNRGSNSLNSISDLIV